MPVRRAMTLFEVALSLLVITAVVAIAMMIFPTGLHGQQQARLQIHAAVTFQEVLDGLRSAHPTRFGTEGRLPEDRPYLNARVWSPDADSLLLTRRGGIRPIPDDIAWRLDSEDDEIARHLAAGGRLYYVFGDETIADLVFTVIGAPQLNAMKWHPQMKWPYYDYLTYRYARGQLDANRPVQEVYAGDHNPRSSSDNRGLESDAGDRAKWGIGFDGAVLQRLVDTDPGFDQDWYLDATHDEDWFRQHDVGGNGSTAGDGRIQHDAPEGTLSAQEILDYDLDGDGRVLFFPEYARVRLERALDELLPGGLAELGSPPPALDQFAGRYDADPLRFAATANVLRAYAFATGVASQHVSRDGGFQGRAWPDPDAAVARFQLAHEWLLRHHRFVQLHRPYDLRVVRQVSHPLMGDHPLLQQDPFSPPLADPQWSGTPGANRFGRPIAQVLSHSWDFLSGAPLAAVRSESFSLPKDQSETWTVPTTGSFPSVTWNPAPNQDVAPGRDELTPQRMRDALLDPSDDLEHRWNLTARFDARERCRQFVAWQVDWMRYEDFERLPGCSWEAATNPTQLPRNRDLAGWSAGLADNPADGRRMSWWQSGRDDRDSLHPDYFTSWEVEYWKADKPVRNITHATPFWSRKDWAGLSYTRAYALWGADRNGNDHFEQGDVPPDTRLRATTIARFVFYDPRGMVPGQE